MNKSYWQRFRDTYFFPISYFIKLAKSEEEKSKKKINWKIKIIWLIIWNILYGFLFFGSIVLMDYLISNGIIFDSNILGVIFAIFILFIYFYVSFLIIIL